MINFLFLASLVAASATPDPSILKPRNELNIVPFLNNALWQEAVGFDAKNGNNSWDNRSWYNMYEIYQGKEYCSNSTSGDPINDASGASQSLQQFQAYPCEFDVPQAADPGKTIGVSS